MPIKWKAFQDYVRENWLSQEFPSSLFDQYEQPTLQNGARPDFVVQNKNNGAIGVIDAKDKDSLTIEDLLQLIGYSNSLNADYAAFVVAQRTTISPITWSALQRLGFQVARTHW